MATSKRHLDAVDKSIRVLNALRELNGAGVTELAKHVGLPKTTVHAHLSTLEHNQLIVNEDGLYRLGLQFVSFGEYVKRQNDLFEIIPSEIDRLSEETGELANFLVEEHGQGVYLYKSRSKRGVRTKASIGVRRPLHCTGVGKAILAHLPEERIDQIIEEHGLEPRTENTIVDRDALLEELETIREQGYAADDEEIQQGLRCVAAPVRGPEGQVSSGVSVTGPIGRIKGERFREQIPELVMNAANVIEVNARNLQ